MLNKRPCLIQICNAFSTAAAPADHCQLAQEWGLVGLCPLPVDEVFHSVFSVYSLSLFFLFLFSFSTRCPPTYTLTVNGSTDVVGKMMGGDKDGDREREREWVRRRDQPTVWLSTRAEKDDPCRGVIGFKVHDWTKTKERKEEGSCVMPILLKVDHE